MAASWINPTLSRSLPVDKFYRKEHNTLVDRGLPQALVVKHAYAGLSIPYDDVIRLSTTAAEEKENIRRERDEKEKNRQSQERRVLQDQFRRMETDFTDAWKKKINKLHDDLEREKEQLLQVHRHRELKLEEKISEIRARPSTFPKYSPMVLEKMDREVTLVKLHRYDEAKEVKKDLEKQRKVEEAQFFADLEKRFEGMRVNLARKHQDELKTLERKRHRAEKLLEWKKTESLKCLHQNFENNVADLEHAHSMEFQAPALSAPTLHATRPSYFATASTFRGTQIKRRIESGNVLPLLNGSLKTPLDAWREERDQRTVTPQLAASHASHNNHGHGHGHRQGHGNTRNSVSGSGPRQQTQNQNDNTNQRLRSHSVSR